MIKRRLRMDPRVVDQDVNSPQALDRLADSAQNLFFIADIGLEKERFSTVSLDLRRRLAPGLHVLVDEGDGRALHCQGLGNRPAHPSTPSRHNSNFPLESHHSPPGCKITVLRCTDYSQPVMSNTVQNYRYPPEATIVSPVMYPALSEARKRARLAISSGLPNLLTGIFLSNVSLPFSSRDSHNISVSILLGTIALTVIPYCANSLLRAFVNAITPPFAAA